MLKSFDSIFKVLSFLKRLLYDAVLVWGLNPVPPALEASTLPLGYRGGGVFIVFKKSSSVVFSSTFSIVLIL